MLAAAGLALALWLYPAEYVRRTLLWQGADVGDRLRFPLREVRARPDATELEFDLQPERVRAAFAAALPGEALEPWLERHRTLGFVVLQHGRVLYEGYFHGHRRDERATSFSVAKSLLSALVGAAIDDGLIASVDDPVTRYLPELGARDPRFERLTLRHLLGMREGIAYRETGFLHGDDAKTYYWPDLRALALEQTRFATDPGPGWLYNNYHPLLLGMVLERAARLPVAIYLERRLWQPAGMAADASWSLDSAASGFEKLESGVNARTLDFARFGQLFLDGGVALDGRRVLSAEWVRASTSPAGGAPLDHLRPGLYYQLMWWGQRHAGGGGSGGPSAAGGYSFSARGNLGQFVHVSPRHGVVIARNGIDYGVPPREWMQLFDRMAAALGGARPRAGP